jgi:nucleosome binding factor SPN SPT16 subunit
MRTQDDPRKFVEDGGWDFLDLEKSDDEDEDEEESEGEPCMRAANPFLC